MCLRDDKTRGIPQSGPLCLSGIGHRHGRFGRQRVITLDGGAHAGTAFDGAHVLLRFDLGHFIRQIIILNCFSHPGRIIARAQMQIMISGR